MSSGEPVLVPLKCDICNREMTMTIPGTGGALFTCECGQGWNFEPDRVTCKILARLYPYRMKEEDALYQEFLDYRVKQSAFYLDASVLSGLMSQQEADRQAAAFDLKLAAKRREIAKRKVWWHRLQTWYIGLWERS
jgi:hypothetical protein